ncbi:MAG: class I SAM-dependent methyltransferase [Candidatus Thorarchaeota archaeon]
MSDRDSTAGLQTGYEGVAEFYDLFADNSDLPFYVEYARRTGSPILDIAAGAGRVTYELARNGFQVTALEKSPSMLAVARSRLERAPPDVAARVSIVEGCMTDFELDQRFALVIIPSSFGHATTSEQQLSAFRCIRNHMRPDGLFLLDLYPGALNLRRVEFEDDAVSLADGSQVSRRGIINPDPVEQLIRVSLVFNVKTSQGEKVETRRVESEVAIIFNREADLLLKMSGFRVLEELGGFKGESYGPDSQRRILVLKRKE